MSIARFVSSTVNRLVVYFLPIIVLTMSITSAFVEPNLYKESFLRNNTYNQTAEIIKTYNSTPQDFNKGLSSLVLLSTIQDLATPQWLQNLTEKNIDKITFWLNNKDNKDSKLELYLPNEQISKSLNNTFVKNVKKLTQNNGLPNCQKDSSNLTPEQILQNLCLPQDQLQAKKTQFTIDQLLASPNYASNFLQNNIPILKNSQVNLEQNFAGINSSLNFVHDTFWKVKSILPVLFAWTIGLLVLNLVLSVIRSKRKFHDISRQLWSIGWHTCILCISLVAIIGGWAFVSSGLKELILPGLFDGGLSNIWSLVVVNISVRWVFWAGIFGVSCLGLSLIAKVLDSLNIGQNTSKFKPNSTKDGIKNSSSNSKLDPKLAKNKTNKTAQTATIKPESGVSIRQRVNKYYQQKSFDSDYDSNISNFTIPNQQPEFNYDAILVNQIQTKIAKKNTSTGEIRVKN